MFAIAVPTSKKPPYVWWSKQLSLELGDEAGLPEIEISHPFLTDHHDSRIGSVNLET